MPDTLAFFTAVPVDTHVALSDLAEAYSTRVADIRAEVQGELRVVGFDWTNIGSLLLKVLPGILAMLAGGSPLSAVMALLDFVLPLIIPDQQLVDLAKQILSLLLGAFK